MEFGFLTVSRQQEEFALLGAAVSTVEPAVKASFRFRLGGNADCPFLALSKSSAWNGLLPVHSHHINLTVLDQRSGERFRNNRFSRQRRRAVLRSRLRHRYRVMFQDRELPGGTI